MKGEEAFPVHSASRKEPGCPATVPLAILAPHEQQALRNHSQSLARLASRGGLSLCEMAAVLDDRGFRQMPHTDALARVQAAIADLAADSLVPPIPHAGRSAKGAR